jgi:hypothetical protein
LRCGLNATAPSEAVGGGYLQVVTLNIGTGSIDELVQIASLKSKVAGGTETHASKKPVLVEATGLAPWRFVQAEKNLDLPRFFGPALV